MHLLSALGISHSVLHDEDAVGNDEHKEWNALTLASKTQETDKIEKISPDLEGFLGVSKPKSQYSKPQALLSKYNKKEIEKSAVEKFRALVEKCLSPSDQPL